MQNTIPTFKEKKYPRFNVVSIFIDQHPDLLFSYAFRLNGK